MAFFFAVLSRARMASANVKMKEQTVLTDQELVLTVRIWGLSRQTPANFAYVLNQTKR